MKKYVLLLAGFICVAALAGCATMAPVLNVKTPISSYYTTDQVRDAIYNTGLKRGWAMQQVAPGIIDGHISTRGHRANIRITYSTSGYAINYVNSDNLKATDGKIHRNYNRWISRLDNDIQTALFSIPASSTLAK